MNKLNKNLSIILYMQLALENYEANTGNENELLNQSFEELNNFRKTRNDISEKEQLKRSEIVLNKLNNAINSIGRDKFIFYDDGSIGYTWDKSLYKKDNDKQSKYDETMSKIFEIKQEIEVYETNTKDISSLSNKAFLELDNLRNLEYELNEKDKIELSKKVLKSFQKVINIIERK